MKPPACAVCGRSWEYWPGIETVEFADYEPLPDGFVGHPRGLAWICPAHLERARAKISLPEEQAITCIRSELGVELVDPEALIPSLWLLDAGSEPMRVAAFLRSVLTCSLEVVIKLVRSPPVRLQVGHLEDLQRIRSRLSELGATAEVRS